MFQLIEEEGRRRGWEVQTMTYLGAGHFPEIDSGLDLPRAVASVQRQMKQVDADRIFALSFGVTVVAWFLAHQPDFLVTREMRFWAPVSFATYEKLYGDVTSLTKKNAKAAQANRGVVLADTLWSTLEPLETLLTKISERQIFFGVGDEDRISNIVTMEYLAQVIRHSTTNNNVTTTTIPGGVHEMSRETISSPHPTHVLESYLRWIFS